MKKYYMWLVCIMGMLMHLCNCGLVVTSFSIFLPLIREGIDLTNTQVSMMITLRSLVALFATMAARKYYKKLTLRKGIALACALVPVGLFLFSVADSVALCYLAVVIMGFSYGVGAMVPVSLLMHNWFESKCSTAIAICSLGSGISTICAPPIIARITETLGLQAAFRSVAVFVLVCAVLIIVLIRDYPADIGLKPYRTDREEIKKISEARTVNRGLVRWEWILLMVIAFLNGACGTPATSNMSIHLVTAGYTASQAATALAVFGAVLIVGKVVCGACSDRFGTYRTNYVFIGFLILSCFTFLLADGRSIFWMMFPSIAYGIGGCTGALGVAYWTGDFSEPEEFARHLQVNQTMFSIGSLIVTPFPGILADLTGSYNPMYLCCGIMAVAVMIMIQILYIRHLPGGKHRKEAAHL